MFHAFDNPGFSRRTSRSAWIALLARAPLFMMEQTLQPSLAACRIEWLRRPETGLYMVQGRIGGTGERFNLGEVTVTRCALRILEMDARPSPVGVAYVIGRQHRQAELAAVADALLQQAAYRDTLEQALLEPVRQYLALQIGRRQAQVQSTKVDFFTLAREAGSDDRMEGEA